MLFATTFAPLNEKQHQHVTGYILKSTKRCWNCQTVSLALHKNLIQTKLILQLWQSRWMCFCSCGKANNKRGVTETEYRQRYQNMKWVLKAFFHMSLNSFWWQNQTHTCHWLISDVIENQSSVARYLNQAFAVQWAHMAHYSQFVTFVHSVV